MTAESEYVLRAERKDNSDGKTMFGLFLLVRTSLLNHEHTTGSQSNCYPMPLVILLYAFEQSATCLSFVFELLPGFIQFALGVI